MRTAIAAYACDPLAGSEPGAGWALLRAASTVSRTVNLYTRVDGGRQLEEAVCTLGTDVRVHRVATTLKRGPAYFRYAEWLWRTRRLIEKQVRDGQLDLVHHATYASDWLPPAYPAALPAGVASVWGPVGGASYAPWRLVRRLSVTSIAGELTRAIIGRLIRPVVRNQARKSSTVVLAMNRDSARALSDLDPIVCPNVVVPYSEPSTPSNDVGSATELLFVGRLLEWKGALLAVRALAHLEPEWSLKFIGDGPARRRIARTAERLGVNVTMVPRLGRGDVLRQMSSARALLLPSLHDSGGWVAAEAASVGTPVICLDLGGTAMLAGTAAVVVEARPSSTVEERIARAVRSLTETPRPDRDSAWTQDRLNDQVLRAYETARIRAGQRK